jgi:lysine-arginine-ornithine-binding protein
VKARLAATLFFAVLPFLAGPAGARDWSTIRIATEGAYPPFNFVDAQNQPQGFEVDLARALCERVRATCTIVADDWDALIPGLKEGRFDAVMASLEITEERRHKVAFSRPYYRTPAVFMTRKAAPIADLSPNGMKGKRIGAMAGTVYATYLEALYKPGSEVRLYANQDEASLDLALERIDAVLGDKIALAEWLKRGKEANCCAFQADAPHDVARFGEGYGIALRKEDADLRALFDRALDAIVADGTYERIRATYWPFPIR